MTFAPAFATPSPAKRSVLRGLILGTALAVLAVLPASAGIHAESKPRVKTARTTPEQDRIDQAVSRLVGRVDYYWHNGDYDSCAYLYSVVVGLDPHNVGAWQDYGWLLWSGMARDDAAMRVFLRGLAANPTRYEMYFEAGELEYHRRRFLSAAAWMAKATNHDAPWTVWHMRAHCLEYAGEIGKSKVVWRTILAKFKDDPTAKLNYQRILEGRYRRNPVFGVEQPKSAAPPPRHEPPMLPPGPDGV